MKRTMEEVLEEWEEERRDERNRALRMRMSRPCTTGELLRALASLRGLNAEERLEAKRAAVQTAV